MWIRRLKYPTLGDAMRDPRTGSSDTTAALLTGGNELLDLHRRMDKFRDGVKVYNTRLILQLIAFGVAVLVILVNL